MNQSFFVSQICILFIVSTHVLFFILHAWMSIRTCSPPPQRLNVIKFRTCKSPPPTYSEERKIHLDYD